MIDQEECAYADMRTGEPCLAPAAYVIVEPYDPPEEPTREVFACADCADGMRRELVAEHLPGYAIHSLPRA